MTETNTPATGRATAQRDTRAAPAPGTQPGTQSGTQQVMTRPRGESSLWTEHGRTTIAGEVVAKISGMAAREIKGVYDFGTGTARALGAIKGRLGAEDGVTRGMSVEVGERQAAVDIDLIVEYGAAIPDLAESVRRNVIDAVEHMCGLEVTEVNIAVDDVHLPRQEAPEGSYGESRVQ